MAESRAKVEISPPAPGLVEVRRGFGTFDLNTLKHDEFVCASGLRDGGWVVWRHEAKREAGDV